MRSRAGKADAIFTENVDVTFVRESHGLSGKKDLDFPFALGLHPRRRPSIPEFSLMRLVETPIFQRLHTIKQLGFVERIWPQATHTRYDHSLDSAQLVRQVITQIWFGGAFHKPFVFSREHIQTFLIATLLHDIGHYPFSHCLDGLRSLLPAHKHVR